MKNSLLYKKISFKKLFSLLWQIFSHNFFNIIIILIIIGMPLNLISEFASKKYPKFSLLFSSLILVIFQCSLIYFSYCCIKQESFHIKNLIKKISIKFKDIVFTEIILFLVFSFFFLLLIIPGIIASIYCSFTMQSLIIKNTSGMNSLQDSKNLVSGNWWSIFFIQLINSGINASIPLITKYYKVKSLLFNTGLSFIENIFTTFFIILLTILFLNLNNIKNNKEINLDQTIECNDTTTN